MKTTMKVYYLALVLLLAGSAGVQAQMTIGSQDKPHDGAVLHLKSATKGLLLTNVALNADLTQFVLDGAEKQDEAKGMLVYNTTDDKVYFWDGAKWNSLLGNGGSTDEEIPEGTVECAGLIFMDRNLGADPTADPNPTPSYNAGTNGSPTGYLNGDYYQWGRVADGHEKWNSPVASETPASSSDYDDSASGKGQIKTGNPRYGKFIMGTSESNYDWRMSKNDDLWNETGTGLVNPCPTGFRVPTQLEWQAVNALITHINISEFSVRDGINVGSTTLFLPAAGYRHYSTGEINYVTSAGSYWTSTVLGNNAILFSYGTTGGRVDTGNRRGYGFNVRCIKN